MSKNSKRSGGKAADEAVAGATERVLKQICELYEGGLAGAPTGAMGLKAIAESPLLGMKMRKARKKINVMIVGNHSAGKSSFINWYIGEDIQKTGVAIETRGFTFVTAGKKRETLNGDATIHYYEHLEDFTRFEGILPNLFTEISTSKDKNFICVDFIDTPGLVDGDMQYPFDVQEAIMWMAEHVDLILVFLDPIGQATCRRTMEVVERLNNSAHLEKLQYFMSKADAVDKEADRQRVLIQITQNLATRIRNSHAFNLPTFYLPREDGPGCSIPNAIEDVCKEIDKAINQTVQKNLKTLKQDCNAIISRVDQVLELDRAKRAANFKALLQGSSLYLLATAAGLALALLCGLQLMPTLCKALRLGFCATDAGAALLELAPAAAANFRWLAGILAIVLLTLLVAGRLTLRVVPTFTKRDKTRLGEFKAYVRKVAELEKSLYAEYFSSIRSIET